MRRVEPLMRRRELVLVARHGITRMALSRTARAGIALALALNLGACAAEPGSSSAGPSATSRPTTEASLESASVALMGITQADAEELIEIARDDPWLQDELDATDNRVVQILDPGKGGGPIVWFVDYTNRRSIAIEFGADGSSIAGRTIDDIKVPEISPGERASAAQVALQDEGVRARAGVGAQLIVHSITGGGGPACANSRCLVVFVQPEPAGNDGLIGAVVDLSIGAVTQMLP